ncbi:Predicted dithiol-disulfide isomerase, DsbA family [Saccharopolyspora antimicrobica]|uniref:DsbA family dithiol-disulfide isomerase n=1 Tax=Saccharopolyspora antimicrobica TaxID=455193 RepID=A0A1I4YH36_9PSEU|nr:DsbA family protein [Saccharopolyspora antimicrobica]RKT82672.1 putative DsbA family dithiol-disulfide isomerase [Saccharopolyspora antimicrobica]SFN37282.1 Predicted dithiol-disulfide isomerase, DsbA family [Saccharopolyspora antimicrobica]
MTAQIHIWSDYVCPFCLIADEVIERAIADLPDVEVVHHAHELRPRPAPTLRPEDPYLPDIWRRVVYPMARRHDVPVQLPSVSPQPYTELAFRGAQYALDQGRADAYHRRIMTAFFREDLDIGNREVLARLAGEAGLDPVAYTAALDDAEYAERHRQELAESERLDITVVPTIIIGDRRIQGVADEGVIRRALHEAFAA